MDEEIDLSSFGLSTEQLEDLQEAFTVFDPNGDGTITTHKLGRVMRSLGQDPTEAEVQDLINAVDEDGNGTIEFEEFVAMMAKRLKEVDREDELKAAFEVFDHNALGHISLTELSSVLKILGQDFTEEEMEDMIRETDGNGDGFVTYEDFLRLVRQEDR